MENQKKIIARARLIADGISRNHKWSLLTPAEMVEALEILAEELAKIEHDEEAPKIRARMEAHGLQFPPINSPVHADSMDGQETDEETSDTADSKLCGRLTTVYTQASTVQNGAASQGQVQQMHGSRDLLGVSRTLRNTDTQCREGAPVHPGTTLEAEEQPNPSDSRRENRAPDITKDIRGSDSCSTPTPLGSTGSWTWRNWSYNRVPPAIEEAIRERFKQGWSKSRLAREFRLNRRTIIRICNSYAKTPQLV